MAPQLTATNGRGARLLASCRPRATSSLPLPDSPVMSTVHPVSATRSTTLKTFTIVSEQPMTDAMLRGRASIAVGRTDLNAGGGGSDLYEGGASDGEHSMTPEVFSVAGNSLSMSLPPSRWCVWDAPLSKPRATVEDLATTPVF